MRPQVIPAPSYTALSYTALSHAASSHAASSHAASRRIALNYIEPASPEGDISLPVASATGSQLCT